MSERMTTEEAMITQFMNLLDSYKKVYVTLARAELRAETRNRPVAYESGVIRSLEIMERSGFLIGQTGELMSEAELEERGILRE